MNQTSFDRSRIFLVKTEINALVEAELWDAITDKNLADWEAEWRPETEKLLKELNREGIETGLWPQSRHWDWRAKTVEIQERITNQCFSVVCENQTQAMMITELTHRAKIESQKNAHLVYVEFLEAAPWNRSELIARPTRFGGCGSILVKAAIEYSIAEGFEGRIGLHSLPQANDFYGNKLKMTDLGADSRYQNLRYFEMTQEQAKRFISEEH